MVKGGDQMVRNDEPAQLHIAVPVGQHCRPLRIPPSPQPVVAAPTSWRQQNILRIRHWIAVWSTGVENVAVSEAAAAAGRRRLELGVPRAWRHQRRRRRRRWRRWRLWGQKYGQLLGSLLQYSSGGGGSGCAASLPLPFALYLC